MGVECGHGPRVVAASSVVGFTLDGFSQPSQAHFWQALEVEKEERGVLWWWLVCSRGPVVCGGIEKMGAFIDNTKFKEAQGERREAADRTALVLLCVRFCADHYQQTTQIQATVIGPRRRCLTQQPHRCVALASKGLLCRARQTSKTPFVYPSKAACPHVHRPSPTTHPTRTIHTGRTQTNKQKRESGCLSLSFVFACPVSICLRRPLPLVDSASCPSSAA